MAMLKDTYYKATVMKTVLVTGASGYLGQHLVNALLRNGTKVIAILGRSKDKAINRHEVENLEVIPCSELFERDFGHVDTLIHTAFSRSDNMAELTSSVNLAAGIIEMVNRKNVDSVINISTQGIYRGLKPGENVTEEGIVEPDTAYGLAKWAVENMFNLGCKKQYTHIRMASLSSNARFLDLFVDSVINNKRIIVVAPRQYASIMDISDAVEGILSVEQLSINQRNAVYNLGPEVQHSILDYALSANEVGKNNGFAGTTIEVEDAGKEFAICMDCSKLMAQTNWKPKVTKMVMLQKMFKRI